MSFVKAGLIDEFRFVMAPLMVRQGSPVFDGMLDRLRLEAKDTRRFDSGNVVLYYEPSRRAEH